MCDEALSSLLKEAAAQHHLAEPDLPEHHWADWYAPYLRARTELGANAAAASAFADLAVEHPGVV